MPSAAKKPPHKISKSGDVALMSRAYGLLSGVEHDLGSILEYGPDAKL